MTNPLLSLQSGLAERVRADPLLGLAHTVAWLDPCWRVDETLYDDVPDDEDSSLSYALFTLRTVFPDIYIDAIDMLRCGGTYHDLDHLICSAISERGLPLDQLEWFAFGVPLPAYGILFNDPNWQAGYPDIPPLLELFGIDPSHNRDGWVISDHVYSAARLLVENLTQHDAERCQQVGWCVAWLFACSGNCCLDFDDEMMAEMQLLSWDKADVAFALAIVEEADELYTAAMRGLEILKNDPAMRLAVQDNAARVYRALKRQKGNRRDDPRVTFQWPRLANGAG